MWQVTHGILFQSPALFSSPYGQPHPSLDSELPQASFTLNADAQFSCRQCEHSQWVPCLRHAFCEVFRILCERSLRLSHTPVGAEISKAGDKLSSCLSEAQYSTTDSSRQICSCCKENGNMRLSCCQCLVFSLYFVIDFFL